MIQLISLLIFLFSLSGIILVLYKKIPVLASLPKNSDSGLKKGKLILGIEKQLQSKYLHLFKKQVLLQKFLSKFRIVILKLEKKTDQVLQKIRKKSLPDGRQAKKDY